MAQAATTIVLTSSGGVGVQDVVTIPGRPRYVCRNPFNNLIEFTTIEYDTLQQVICEAVASKAQEDSIVIEISRAQLDMLAPWFRPEAPGPIIGPHVLRTGFGRAWVNRWPAVQAVVVESAYNLILAGEPAALDPTALAHTAAGFLAAPEAFLPLLEAAFPSMKKWPRVIGKLPGSPIQPPSVKAELRRFNMDDANDLTMLSAESIWVSQTWGGAHALAQSGYGWGAWVDGVLVSVACTFFLGEEYEDIGIVTEPGYQAFGLSSACTYELCLDIIARGRIPSWSTSLENHSSWRVAQKLGFVHQRDDWLYVVGRDLPKSES